MQKFEEQEEEVKQWRLSQQRANTAHGNHDQDVPTRTSKGKGDDKGCDCRCRIQ